MWYRSLIDSLARRRRCRTASPKPTTRRFLVEGLEDRCLMTFSPATSFPVGVNPQAAVTADFNNDGKLDVATANAGGNNVSVLLGNGDGTFQSPLTTTTGISPELLVAADFNNDGYLDVATANNAYYPWGYENTLSVLLGNGKGTFQAAEFAPTDGFELLALTTGDFNADGNVDLIYVSWNTYDMGETYVQVLTNDGLGHFIFGDRQWIPTFNIPYTSINTSGLAVGDLNNDHRPDVVAAVENYGLVSVLLGNPDGTLSYSAGSSDFDTGNGTRGVVIGDFTGDNIPDLAAAGYTSVAILPGNGDGTFAAPIVEITNNTQQTATAIDDFNGDRRPDIVAPDEAEGTLTALLGLGGGMLSLVGDHAVGSSPQSVAVGDFNGDGRPDAVTANAGSDKVSVMLNDGAWPDVSIPRLRIDDASVAEGNTGVVAALFTVRLSATSNQDVTVAYTTANGTAAAGSDYQVVSGTLRIRAGEIAGTIAVLVNGDRLAELNEQFFVNLSSPTNVVIVDGQAAATITDDEPRISINDVTLAEGLSGTTLFMFAVTLIVPTAPGGYDEPVTLSYHTKNGTAKAGQGDYVAKTGTLTFAPGETTKTITIEVKGDSKREARETFYVELFGLSSNAVFTKSRGIGTILNDD